jgi:uncharacterized protein GlcG (DUF336 family)
MLGLPAKPTAARDGTSRDVGEIAPSEGSSALTLGLVSQALLQRAQELTNLIDAVDTKAQSQLFTGTGGVLDMDDARLAGAAGVSSDTSRKRRDLRAGHH